MQEISVTAPEVGIIIEGRYYLMEQADKDIENTKDLNSDD
jgi:hypothetical protein